MDTEKKTVFVLQIAGSLGALFILLTRNFQIDFISVVMFLSILQGVYYIYKAVKAK